MAAVYKYTCSVDQSGNISIEFIDPPADKDFIKQLIRAFESLNVQVINYEDLWIHDEIIFNVSSNIGKFTIFRNSKDHYFIEATENPDATLLLDSLLSKDPIYRKI